MGKEQSLFKPDVQVFLAHGTYRADPKYSEIKYRNGGSCYQQTAARLLKNHVIFVSRRGDSETSLSTRIASKVAKNLHTAYAERKVYRMMQK
jgi:hypothetical protein